MNTHHRIFKSILTKCKLILICCLVLITYDKSFASECDVQDPENRNVLTIDARNITMGTPRREYGLKDELQVDVINKNPFRFSYTIVTEERIVEEPAIDRFIKLPFFGSIATKTVKDIQDPGSDPGTAVPKSQPFNARQCPESWNRRQDDLVKMVSEHERKVEQSRVEANALNGILNPLKSGLERSKTVLIDPNASCSVLTDEIKNLRAVFPKTARLTVQLSTLGSSLESADAYHTLLKNQIRKNTNDLAADSAVSRLCRLELKQAFSQAEGRQSAYRAKYAEILANKILFSETIDAIDKFLKDTQEASSKPGAFTSSITLGPYSSATDVTFTLSRKDSTLKNSSAEKVASLIANFGGGPKFSISAGVGIGSLESREFQREQSIGMDGSTVNIVGLSDNSDWRATPMVFIHGQIHEDWSITAGLGPHTGDDGTNVDIFLGASWHFASKGRISLGAYFGKVQELGGGFQVGDSIPEDIAEIPVSTSNEVGVGLFMSWALTN